MLRRSTQRKTLRMVEPWSPVCAEALSQERVLAPPDVGERSQELFGEKGSESSVLPSWGIAAASARQDICGAGSELSSASDRGQTPRHLVLSIKPSSSLQVLNPWASTGHPDVMSMLKELSLEETSP